MNKLNPYLKFEISKYLTCQEYIRLYLVNKSFSEALNKDLDLKIPVFITSETESNHYDEYTDGDTFDNLESAIKDLEEKIENLENIDINKDVVKQEIKKLETDYIFSIFIDRFQSYESGETEIQIKSIPKRYSGEIEFGKDFNIEKYVYDKIKNIVSLEKNNKIILEEVLKLNKLILDKSYEEHIEVIERDYLEGKVKLYK